MAELKRVTALLELYQEALSSARCAPCGGPFLGDSALFDRQLAAENARLKAEIARLTALVAQLEGENANMSKMSNNLHGEFSRSPLPHPNNSEVEFSIPASFDFHAAAADAANDMSVDRVNSLALLGMADTALTELRAMVAEGGPLWFPATPENNTMEMEILNSNEYLLNVTRGSLASSVGLKREATRAADIVNISTRTLLEIFNDPTKWAGMFSGIVLKAATVKVLSSGMDYDGSLQLMAVEFQLPSPAVPTRKTTSLRYIKKLPDGTWMVVDVSLDINCCAPIENRCLRRPSGCLIQELGNRQLKVTWVEHIEVDDSFVHCMYKPVVNSGFAFGAQRWLAAMSQQCNRLTSIMNCNLCNFQEDAQVTVLKLAESAALSFYAGVVASASHGWVKVSGTSANDIQIACKKNVDDPKLPQGILLNASVSFWLYASPKKIHDLLSNLDSRAKWDATFESGKFEEVGVLLTGGDPVNRISVLQSPPDGNTDETARSEKTIIVQESFYNAVSSILVYAPVSVATMNAFAGEPGKIQLLPQGFAIVPDGPPGAATGSLVTASLHVLADPDPQSELSPASVETAKKLVMSVAEIVKNEIISLGA